MLDDKLHVWVFAANPFLEAQCTVAMPFMGRNVPCLLRAIVTRLQAWGTL